ncbi:MAG TPA: DUF3667 domain-containing protein [Ferruginibacter sp.]|nr:DUF3667 domain-containing protein [Ferruginibacter sp.]
MISTCMNCGTTVKGSFCSHCGQSANTHRISTHFLWHDIQHGLLHVDKGILFSAKELFTRPGHSIREFLEGKRVKHFKPVSLVLILAGIYGFLSHYFHINLLANNIQIKGSGEKFEEMRKVVASSSEWLASHYSMFSLLQIPVLATGTWLLFKRAGYNFMEHIIIHSFLTGQRLIIRIITFPLFYAFSETSTLRTVARITDLVAFTIAFWSLYQLFKTIPKWQRAVRTAGSFAITFAITFTVMFILFKILLGL